MSFLSSQNSDALFNNTIVNNLTVKGKLTMLQEDSSGGMFNVPLNIVLDTITSPDGTNEIDLSKEDMIIMKTKTLKLDDTIIDQCKEIKSTDETSYITLGTNEIDIYATTIKPHGTLNMGSHDISGISKLEGTNNLVQVASNYALQVGGNVPFDDCKVQGAYLNWNEPSQVGKTVFVNNCGLGSGGFEFYNIKNDASGNVDPNSYAQELVDIDGSGNMKIYSNHDSTAGNNGALVCYGGCGISKNLNVSGTTTLKNTNVNGDCDISGNVNIGGIENITNTTNATSHTTGCLVLGGGCGIAKDLYVHGNIYATGNVSSADTNNYEEFHFYNLRGNGSNGSSTITLNNNQNTTNYMVFPSIYYGYTGSSGTYNANSSSSALQNIIIYNITKSSFDWVVNKDTADNVNLYICFHVIFSNALNFPKTYDANGNAV